MKPVFYFFLMFCLFAKLTHAQVTYPCEKFKEVRDNYKPNENWHTYKVENILVDLKLNPGVSVQEVFNLMLKKMAFVAPDAPEGPVLECTPVKLSGKWPIVTSIDYEYYSVTNYTMPDHLLHEGKIKRTISQKGDKIVVSTIGSGNNSNAVLAWVQNLNMAMTVLWTSVDNVFIAEINRHLKTRPTQWNWQSLESKGAGYLEKLKRYTNWSEPTEYETIMYYKNKGCDIKVAEADLNGDGIPGMIFKVSGPSCCNFRRECSFLVYEANGYKRLHLIDSRTDLVRPAINGIIASSGNYFELTDYSDTMNNKKD